mmetsp:Transcript_123077/g.217952  ORF Transcript_123077/g.217952 Transcript_123077/m.217952 type:complete len:900 (+) Transcript_123077:74-2773(+)
MWMMGSRAAGGEGQDEERQPPLQADSGSSGEIRVSSSLLWLKLGRGSHLEITSNATDVLRKERGDINTVMICGNVRTGKSYLMNALVDQPVFGVSSQARSFTKGVWISPDLVALSQFDSRAKSSTPKLAFVDMEGQGDDGGIKQDVKLATPLLIMSKAVILNDICAAGPAKEDILGKLEVMMHAAMCVGEKGDRKHLFGCLHLVLRDCPQREEECKSIIFDKEDILSIDTDEEEEAAKKRNDIRIKIEHAFESITVWCLPKIMATPAPPDYRDAGREYAEKVDAMRQELASQLASPKLVAGRPLTGSLIATLLPQLAEEIKSEKPALNPPSLMDRVIEMEAQNLVDEIMKRAKTELESRVEKFLPMAPEQLSTEVETIQKSLTDELQGLSGQKAREKLLETGKFNGEMTRLTEKNCEQLKKFSEKVEQELSAKYSDQIGSLDHRMEPEKLKAEGRGLQAELNKELAERLDIVPDEDRGRVMLRVTGLVARNLQDLYQKNINFIFDTVQREVSANAKEGLEALELPKHAEELESCMVEIQGRLEGEIDDKLKNRWRMVSDLDNGKRRVLDSITPELERVKENVRARNAKQLSRWAEEAETHHKLKVNEEVKKLVLPKRSDTLREHFNLLRGSTCASLEERLGIVSPGTADGARQRLEAELDSLEKKAVESNEESLRKNADEKETKTVETYMTRLEDLRLPLSAEQLNRRIKETRERTLQNLDSALSVHPKEEAEEIRNRIEIQFQQAEDSLRRENSKKLCRRRVRVTFKSLGLIVFLLAVTWAMDVLKVISLKSISCTLATGGENALAKMWRAPASVTRLREQLCEGEEMDPEPEVPEKPDNPDKPGKDGDDDKRRNDDWADEEARRFAKWASRREVLRWLPYGTGVGIIGFTMCLWSRQ